MKLFFHTGSWFETSGAGVLNFGFFSQQQRGFLVFSRLGSLFRSCQACNTRPQLTSIVINTWRGVDRQSALRLVAERDSYSILAPLSVDSVAKRTSMGIASTKFEYTVSFLSSHISFHEHRLYVKGGGTGTLKPDDTTSKSGIKPWAVNTAYIRVARAYHAL